MLTHPADLPSTDAAEQRVRCPCGEMRRELAANGHRELLDHEERQAGDDAGGDSDGGIAASGRRGGNRRFGADGGGDARAQR